MIFFLAFLLSLGMIIYGFWLLNPAFGIIAAGSIFAYFCLSLFVTPRD